MSNIRSLNIAAVHRLTEGIAVRAEELADNGFIAGLSGVAALRLFARLIRETNKRTDDAA